VGCQCQLQGFGSWPGRSLLETLLTTLLFSRLNGRLDASFSRVVGELDLGMQLVLDLVLS
jgi:hypothetical protein